ncbi:uncharacterized protein At1g24485-like [Punica granatum]|uniref:Uncharacterized protein At1g24485-like n=1 Tax=Punica granatum TaxID=22663 RepID=A0A6P8CTY6_PUNGR|nr:uncharacterized protein At1g24485-like [Punica granatum]
MPTSVNVSKQLPLAMKTVRILTNPKGITWKKYCCSIDMGGTDWTRILARANFYYGNYDRPVNPPSFSLMFDANNWGDVETTLDEPVFYEAIYVVKAKSTHICVAQTEPGMSPFISALEVCRLSYTMEKQSTSDAPSIGTRTAYNEPPEVVMQKAITGNNLTFWLPGNTSRFGVYMYLYFSEVTSVSPAWERWSFLLYEDRLLMSRKPISPPYGSVLKVSQTDFLVANDTKFYLLATADSTLHPTLHAMEAYMLSKGTDRRD